MIKVEGGEKKQGNNSVTDSKQMLTTAAIIGKTGIGIEEKMRADQVGV